MNKILKFFKLIQLNNFNTSEYNDLKSINELRALRFRNQEIENAKKARKYISEINLRYKKINEKISDNFLNSMNSFKKVS